VPSFPLGGVEVLTLPSACLATLANGPRTAVIRAISEVLVIGTTAAVLMVERGRECPLTPSLVVPQGVPSLSSESLHAEPLLMVVVRTATITLMLALPLLAVPLVPVGTRLVVRASGRELLPVVLIAVERSRRVLVRADRLTTHVACVGALAGHPHLAGPAHVSGLVVFAPGHAACLRAVPPCPRVVTLLRLLVPGAARRVCLILVLPPRVMSFPFVFASGLLLRVLLSRMLLLCRRLLRRLPPGLARFDLEDLLNLDFAEFVLRAL